MPLDDAMQFVSRNYESYLGTQRDRKRMEGPRDVSRLPPGFIAPSEGVAYLLHLLADYRMLTVEELTEVEDFVRLRKERLMDIEGGPPPTKRAAYMDPSGSKPLGGSVLGANVGGPARDEKTIMAHQAELQAKILSILNPGASSGGSGGASQASSVGVAGYGGSALKSSVLDLGGQQPGGGNLNLNNPQIQKALDTLLQGGGLNVPSSGGGDHNASQPQRQPMQHQQGQSQQQAMGLGGFQQQQQTRPNPNIYGQPQAPMRPTGPPPQQSFMGNPRMRFN